MSIKLSDLQNEREVLVKDFDALKERISQVDRELITMKSKLNDVHGAIEQIDKLNKMCEKTKTMPEDKEKALNIATS